MEANRDDLGAALDRAGYRVESATDPHAVDPRTGLTRAETEELFRWMN